MKKILGLDLGIGSIGWALIGIDEEKTEESKIEGLGSRVILLKENETTGITQGNGETINSQRTLKRSMRRNMDRYQQRRKMLAQLLEEYGMNFSESLLKLFAARIMETEIGCRPGRTSVTTRNRPGSISSKPATRLP